MDLDLNACYRAIATRDARFDGKLFIAVRTTGIYCRPICPARTPKRENVTFYPSAAAAQEAGFRPCLRCRPDLSPDLGTWKGTWNTVSRALAMIEAGDLDAANLSALADRLGVGERHLRRLFHQHLGASPIAVAQTRRILLAKQLVHDTTLSMTDVAMAAGFGSVRRFNETFQYLFGRPPAQLRRTRRNDPGSSTGMGDVKVRLPYRPPYDWAAVLAHLRAQAIPGVEAVSGERYARTIGLHGATGTITVEQGSGTSLILTVRFPSLSMLPTIIARTRRVFDLSADPIAVAAHLAQDPLLAAVVAELPGARVPGAWDSFEGAVRLLLQHQGSGNKPHREDWVRIITECTVHQDSLELTRTFPDAATLSALGASTMRVLGPRGALVTALAKQVAADPHWLEFPGSWDEAMRRLVTLPGIDTPTAEAIAQRELYEPDAFSGADLQRVASLLASSGQGAGLTTAMARAEGWRPWRAYAALYLQRIAAMQKIASPAVQPVMRGRREHAHHVA
jgi:AraC family transcriptional regulator, regulatory protein of adaptative response / DNA-3-methyladenine glycosylase II